MPKTQICFLFILSLLIPSCRAFEGLDKTEQDTPVLLSFEEGKAIGSVSVFAPGVIPVRADKESEGVFSFIRRGNTSRVPAWYCIVPSRTDVECDPKTSVLSAGLPSVQYPGNGSADEFSMLSVSPAFCIGPEDYIKIKSADSLALPYTVHVTGLEAGSRLHSISIATDSLAISGGLDYNVRERVFVATSRQLFHSLSLQVPDGLSVSEDGSADLQAVSLRSIQDYCGPARIFVSSESKVYSLTADSLCLNSGVLSINLASGAKKSEGKTFSFNDAVLFNSLSAASSARIVASDGTECTLELSSEGCVEKNGNGVCCLCVPPGQGFTVPDCSGKEVTGILLQLTGTASESARFNVYSADKLIYEFSASTTGSNGGLTALSISDFPEEMEISNLSGMRIVPAGETSRISGLVLTVIDYVDPHKWEDGHIDDEFTDLFDIL